jgi:hypothetical protein
MKMLDFGEPQDYLRECVDCGAMTVESKLGSNVDQCPRCGNEMVRCNRPGSYPRMTDESWEHSENGDVKAKQFDFGRNWKNRIRPLLDKPVVRNALDVGMKLQHNRYAPGDPPWQHGRGPWNGQKAKKGCLSWYQPWGSGHSIAPFSWAIGKELYPDLHWGFITSNSYTIAVGYADDWKKPEWVLDILHFRSNTAQQSIDSALEDDGSFCGSMFNYMADFYGDPKEVARSAALREVIALLFAEEQISDVPDASHSDDENLVIFSEDGHPLSEAA